MIWLWKTIALGKVIKAKNVMKKVNLKAFEGLDYLYVFPKDERSHETKKESKIE